VATVEVESAGLTPYVISLYDVSGIQSFVYDSTKLKEIVGASFMVQDALTKWLTEAIESALPDAASRVIDWQGAQRLSVGEVPGVCAEIVYCGGGNAMVLFAGEQGGRAAQVLSAQVTRYVSQKALELTLGKLRIAVAHRNTDLSNFQTDRDLLQRDVARIKSSKSEALPLLGVGITAEGVTDGLPAVVMKDGLGLSKPAVEKRKLFNNPADRFSDLLPHEEDSKTVFGMQLDIDKLWQTRGENHVAVVHIDGNLTGDLIRQTVAGKDYGVAVSAMRSLSRQICECYNSAFRGALTKLIQRVMPDKDLRGRFAITGTEAMGEKQMVTLPVRMVVFAGDDVTFICNGTLALVLAQLFLESLDLEPVSVDVSGDRRQIRLSACAGVAIVKSHYPYRRAYELADQLCASAKHKAKTLARGRDPGSWMDFHIVYSGLTADLDDLRRSHYDVPYLTQAGSVAWPTGMVPFRQHNLLWRPLEVTPAKGGPYTWGEMDRIVDAFARWPRSRLKGLRSAMVEGHEAARLVIKEASSRGLALPPMPDLVVPAEDNALFTVENQSPYFDALELLDFYVGRTEQKEES
jgi:hypothetical protein